MKYIVDIDDTICTSPKDKDGNTDYNNAVPIQSRIDKLNQLFNEGHEIHYYTARGATTGKDWYLLTLSQLVRWNCKFSDLRTGKPHYDVFICDKAINSEEFFKGV